MNRPKRNSAIAAETKIGRDAKQPTPQNSKRESRASVNNRRALPPAEPPAPSPASESREQRVTRRGTRKENKLVNNVEVPKSEPEPVVQKEVDPDKVPFRGFDLEKEKPLLDLIERKSAVLYEQVRKLENWRAIEAAAAITAINKGGPVSLPSEFIEGPIEYAPKIQVVSVYGQEDTLQDIMANLQKPFAAGWTRELVYKCVSDTKPELVQYLSPDGTELKTLQEIKEYMENIYGVSDSSGGLTASGHFSFHKSPITNIEEDCGELMYVVDSAGKRRLVNGKQKKSPTKQIAAELPASPKVVTTEVVQPSTVPPKQETEGQMKQPGPGIPSKGRSLTPVNAQQIKANAAPGTVRRQRMQRNTGVPGMNRHAEEDGMFTISAMHQADPMLVSGLEERRGQMQRDREMREEQNQFGNHMEDDEILPCSIRCPGMTGKVPTLQCKSCLCLYHGACLGFPPNAKFANFICPNCDAKQNALPPKPSMSQKVPVQMMRQRQMGNAMNQTGVNPMMTRRIGQTVISPEFQPIGKGGMSIKRMEIKPPELPGTRSRMAGLGLPLRGQLPPKKGMWPAAKIPIPSLSSGGKNVTITPMAKIPRGRAPPLPTLHPMLPNNNNSLAPPPIRPGRPGFGMPKLVRVGGARTVVPLPDLTRKRAASASPQAPITNNSQRPLSLPLEKRNMTQQWAASAGQFRRYPQAIVTIGNKKFIAMPHGQTDNNKNELDSAPEADSKVVDNGHELEEKQQVVTDTEAFVLGKIFPYLSIRDLLSASRVSRNWNKVASHKDLWNTVRMKNAHIFDFDGFATTLSQRETEVLDLRKMAFESKLNWTALVESLTKIPSLKKVLFGTRASPPSLIEMINERCPNVEVVV